MQGLEPVLRTYNTLIIACNMCNQPREAMAVYKRMLDEGYTPNATTYNALISAHGKAGQLDQVMEVSPPPPPPQCTCKLQTDAQTCTRYPHLNHMLWTNPLPPTCESQPWYLIG